MTTCVWISTAVADEVADAAVADEVADEIDRHNCTRMITLYKGMGSKVQLMGVDRSRGFQLIN